MILALSFYVLAQQNWQAAAIVALLTTCTGGGLWIVARNIVSFQFKYADRYDARIAKLEGEVAARDKIIDELRVSLLVAQTERGALRATVRQHGIPWNPSDWGVRDDRP
jgi:hypothetical protein